MKGMIKNGNAESAQRVFSTQKQLEMHSVREHPGF